MAKSKIQNRAFWYHPLTGKQSQTKLGEDWTFFASSFEFKVYMLIRSAIGERWSISRQYPLLYKPQTSNYDALTWKVDFKIDRSDSSEVYFIEAKGNWIYQDKAALAELQHKIQFLEFVKPCSWQRLVIVGETKPRILDNVRSLNVMEFQDWLRGLYRRKSC